MRSRVQEDEDGAAAVEFALIVPILLMLVFGLMEFGIAFAQVLALSSGARQGARFAAVPNYDSSSTPVATTSCTAILSAVQSGAATLGMSGSQVGVTITSPTGGQACTTTSGGAAKVATDFTAATRTNQPCVGNTASGSAASVTVVASYVGHLTVPLIFVNPTVTFQGTGVYQCEYK